MSTEKTENPAPKPAPARAVLLRNWISLTGLVILIGAIFSFVLLFLLDTLAHSSNPYIGILTYFVAPMFIGLGVLLAALGAYRERRKLGSSASLMPTVVLDLTRPRDRRMLAVFMSGSVVFLLVSAMGSYHAYHFTESVQFCGQACHSVMKPELVTYQHGPHARVSCTECHIGPGATWFVKSKLSGTYQLYAVMFDKYPRPVPTPIKNLRPAQETCEQCHWPKKFVGNLDRTYNYFLGEETNTSFSVRLTMNVGGADITHGPVGGIHWHMNVGNKVEYLARDEARQDIPWVRITDGQGVVTEFRTKDFTNEPSQFPVRRMDCMDCHNRPAHRYASPNKAVDLDLSLGKIDRQIPWIKTNAVYVLSADYKTEQQAMEGIATTLANRYPSDPRIRPTIEAIQQIYRDNFFPEMKASWKKYPDNIGHKDWKGCFRCHDGKHTTADGKRTIKANDCNSCHTILAQGSGADLNTLTPGGQKFKHPGDEVEGLCNECHDGTF